MTTTTDRDAVTIDLGSINELFVAPTPDALTGRFQSRSGMERLREAVRPAERPLAITLIVTGDGSAGDGAAGDRAGEPIDAATVETALRGYCANEIERLDLERLAVRSLGRKELLFGLIFLALCLSVSATVSALGVSPAWLRQFVAEGLIIIGWIALWHPVDMLFFARVPLTRQRRTLRRIQSSSVTILAR